MSSARASAAKSNTQPDGYNCVAANCDKDTGEHPHADPVGYESLQCDTVIYGITYEHAATEQDTDGNSDAGAHADYQTDD